MSHHIFELIQLTKSGNKNYLLEILTLFKGQIKSYGKKANSEDSEQNLYLFLIEFLIKKINLDKLKSKNDLSIICYISHCIKYEFIRQINKQNKVTRNELLFFDEINYNEYMYKKSTENIIFSDLDFFNLLNGLTEKEKNIIIQKYKYGFSTKEIAKKNAVSVQAIYKLEKTAFQKIKKHYLL